MSRSWVVYLEDMLECAARVQRYTVGMQRRDFEADERTRDAVLRNLEIMGEAAKNVPGAIRARHPHVDWRALAGLRDVLAHAYHRVDEAVVWDIVRNRIPPLAESLREIIAQHESTDGDT